MRRRIILGLILVLVLVAAVRLVRLRKKQLMSQRVVTSAVIPVTTGRVTRGDFQGNLVCYGVIESDQQADVRARVGGVVSDVLAHEGDSLGAGQALLELDGNAAEPRDNRAVAVVAEQNLQRSVAGMNRAATNFKATFDNDRMLYEHDAISAQQMENSENRYEEARVQLATLQTQLAAQRTQLSFFTVTAPFAGTVANLLVEQGDVVTPNQILLRIENASPCRVRVTVGVEDLGRVVPAGLVTIVQGSRTMAATVGRIHPSVGATGTGTVDVLLDEPPFGLPLGASVEARLSVDALHDVLLVPGAAVLVGPSSNRVHVVEADTVRVVPVEILADSQGTTAIRGELSPEDILVVGSDSLLMRLANGVHVVTRQASK